MKEYHGICLPYVKELNSGNVTYITLDNREIHNCPVSIDSLDKYIFVPHIKSRIKTIEQKMVELNIKETSYNNYFKF